MHANIGIISGQNKPLIIIDGGLNSKYNTVISSVLGSDYTRHVITNSPYSIDKNQGYLTGRIYGGWTPQIDFSKYTKIEISFKSTITASQDLTFHNLMIGVTTVNPSEITQSTMNNDYLVNAINSWNSILSKELTIDISNITGLKYLGFDWIVNPDDLAKLEIYKLILY